MKLALVICSGLMLSANVAAAETDIGTWMDNCFAQADQMSVQTYDEQIEKLRGEDYCWSGYAIVCSKIKESEMCFAGYIDALKRRAATWQDYIAQKDPSAPGLNADWDPLSRSCDPANTDTSDALSDELGFEVAAADACLMQNFFTGMVELHVDRY